MVYVEKDSNFMQNFIDVINFYINNNIISFFLKITGLQIYNDVHQN